MKSAYALFAAFLFGLSTPLSKILLNDITPLMLAAVYYLGSAIMLYVLSLFQDVSPEAPLEKKDLPYVAGFVLCGGVIAPIMLFTGLRLINASSASILLNFEVILTIHDEHHKHEHKFEISEEFQHSHKHIHAGIEHSHPHTPDTHHKHH